eukprot:CAMPEP_0119109446 /NCGR_PEP_ID=MMETSP1180-20130426/17913_1 /TAXON_ID=3052 ORGANISM="Chlamydomonas cf sp, Strain CCMP681" /NCGR_SAMPLE_ID=MMETSP1180 /ASSEMBLY_ACC=CAM_ASM_000741 /LENGTH=221 /DNA_ID=CAMNT_0007095201 /DNA_START=47 /DNA_END=712 /DNA_ORIENTATION=-
MTSHGLQFRILAMGASLTEGLTRGGSAFHPYSLRLQALLDTAGYEGRAQVVTAGRSGEFVLPTMGDRLARILEEARANNTLYTHVLIHGGTNDAGSGAEPKLIMAGLARMYKDAHKHGAKVVSMTLLGYHQRETNDGPAGKACTELNRLLAEFVKQNGQALGIKCVDLGAGLSPHRQSPVQGTQLACTNVSDLWDDNIHLTAPGYDRMAEMIWEGALKEML